MHDPEMFPSPDTFLPERFLANASSPMQGTSFDLPFGFGRRVCVGMHLARNSLYTCMSRILWAFDILPALNKDSEETLPDRWAFTEGFNSRPVSFACRFIPRSEKVRVIVEQEWASAKEQLGKWT